MSPKSQQKLRQEATPKTFEDALTYLRSHAFDVQAASAVAGELRIGKYGCAAVIGRAANGLPVYIVTPGCVVAGEIATLVDRGYQKFLKTSRFEAPATADHLRSLHAFIEELHEATGTITFYNQALGTVSDEYLYDRLKGREHTAAPALYAH